MLVFVALLPLISRAAHSQRLEETFQAEVINHHYYELACNALSVINDWKLLIAEAGLVHKIGKTSFCATGLSKCHNEIQSHSINNYLCSCSGNKYSYRYFTTKMSSTLAFTRERCVGVDCSRVRQFLTVKAPFTTLTMTNIIGSTTRGLGSMAPETATERRISKMEVFTKVRRVWKCLWSMVLF